MFDPTKSLSVKPPKKPKGLSTVQYALLVEALAEGQIEGFPAPVAENFKLGSFNYNQAAKKNIFFNGTPILRPSADLSVFDEDGLVDIDEGQFNFQNIGLDFRNGIVAQGSTKTGDYSASASSKKTTITITNHGYLEGDVLKIDYTPAGGQPAMNESGTFLVESVTDSDNFLVENKLVFPAVSEVNSSGTCSVFLQAQQPIEGLISVETPVNSGTLGTEIKKDTPVTIQVPHDANNPVDEVRVTISADQFTKKNGKGATTVVYKMEVVDNDGAVYAIEDMQYQLGKKAKKFDAMTIKGKTTKPFSRDHIVKLLDSYSYPVSIKLSRITKDTPKNPFDIIKFSGLSTIIFTKNIYAGIAHIGMRFDSQQFPSLPKRSYLLRGKRIAIPHNATVDTKTGGLTFSGSFNGTLKTTKEWCACPAFVLYDVLTTELSDFIDSTQLDVYSFYNASVYCNELVENLITEGEKEPRFSFNGVLSDQQSAYEVINNICSNFRAVPFFSEGLIKINMDRPQTTPDYVFNRSNVTEEGFSYTGTDVRDRANKVSVSFFDKTLQKFQYVTVDLADLFSASSFTNDTNAKLALGVIHKKIDAFGCTSFGQAKRLARFTLFEDQRSTEFINFETTITEGVLLQPNQIIGVNDPMKAGVRRGGRIVSAVNGTAEDPQTNSTVTIDNSDSTDIPTTGSAKISVIMSDGTVSTKNIGSIAGNVITLASGQHFQEADSNGDLQNSKPQTNSVFVVENTSVALALYRVISVKENSDTITYAVNAIKYHSDKYDFIETFESDLSLQTAQTTVLNEIIDAPENLTIQEEIYAENGQLKSKIIISWQPVLGAVGYRVDINPPEQDFFEINTQSTTVDILDAQLGQYDIDVFSLNGAEISSGTPNTIENFEVVGKIGPPDDLAGLTVEPVDKNFVRLAWNKSEDISVINGGRIYIKHTNLTTGGSFQNSSPIIEAVAGTSTDAMVPKLAGTYVVRARDANDTFSDGTQTVQFALDDSEADDQDTITNINEDNASFAGTKTGVAITADGTGLEMTLLGDGIFDDETDFDTLEPNLDQIGDVATTGTYEFTTVGDLGANNKMPTHFIKEIATTTFLQNTTIDTRNEIDLFSDIDGTKIDEPKVDLFIAATNDDPSTGSPTFTAFEKFSNATFKGRGYKFKAVFTSTKPDENIKISTLRATGSLAQRTETQREGTCVHTVNGSFVSSASSQTITVTPTTSGISGAIVGTDILNGDTVNLTFTTTSLDGTYLASGTLINIAILNHGISIGDTVVLDFTSGTASDGTYTVTDVSTHRVYVQHATTLSTSGNVTLTVAKPDDGTYTVASISSTTSFTVNDADAPTVTKNSGAIGTLSSADQICVTKKTMSSNEGVTSGGTDAGLVRSGAFGVTCTFAKRFKTPPTVNVFQSGATSLFYQPVAITETEFTVRFANASDQLVSTLFSYQATGFGKGDTS